MHRMRTLLALAALTLCFGAGIAPVPAHAKGCLKGAAVGAVAGHMAGHHGVAGAGVGCAVGHHEANKQQPTKNDTASGKQNHS